MARSLRYSPPSSSVARLLDPQAAGRAIAAPLPEMLERSIQLAEGTVDTQTGTSRQEPSILIKRELILNASTDETLSSLIQAYRRSTGARIGASHVVRAILAGIQHSMPALQREIHRVGELRLPGNGKGFQAQRNRFERKLAAAFVAGMRAAAILEIEE